MPRPYSLGNPLDGHYPDVSRHQTGTSWSGGRCYATDLSCSCGWVPQPESKHNSRCVSNFAPSQGGRSYANDAYKAHVREVLAHEANDEALATMWSHVNPRVAR